MAAKKQGKQGQQGKQTQRSKRVRQTASSKKSPAHAKKRTHAAPEARTRVMPLAALRATLGIEVDRVRTYGGHTLILRRGRPVAAVIPYHEYERFIMDINGRNQPKGTDIRMTPAEIMAEVDRVREAIAADWAKNGRPPEANLPAAELIRQIREERTQQILDAARGRLRAPEGE